jgi:predicted enzyme related to lactoylglutathione lyase
MIKGVRKILVPVDDRQSAVEFWTGKVGFDLTVDEEYGGERWTEVSPPDRSLALVLSPRPPDQPRREAPDQLPHSDVFFDCDDIQQTYRELVAQGVVFPTPPVKMHFGWWAMFEDQDGIRYALQSGQQ